MTHTTLPSTPAASEAATIYAAMELSSTNWLLAIHAPDRRKVSRHRLQRTILTTSARFVRSGRRLSIIIERRFADFWQTILAQLDRWSWAPPCA